MLTPLARANQIEHFYRMSKSCLAGVMQLRWKSKYILNENVEEQLQEKLLRHKHHPGIVPLPTPNPPAWIAETIHTLIKGHPLSTKQIKENAEKLITHLHGRHKPLEDSEIQMKLEIAQSRLTSDSSSDDSQSLKSKRAKRLIKQLIYNWQPMEYNETTSLAYLVGRAVQNYTVLYKIFSEIKNREPAFKPYTILDFGSGVGTVLWAASEIWGNSLQQHLCIDLSNQMHDLSEKFIRTANLKIKGVFYREHVPAAPTPKYDIVTSAYSLFELPTASARLSLLANLWEKTDRYLVLVENGTNAGFKILNEARDFILDYGTSQSQQEKSPCVFAPCPHNLSCPRYTNDNTPCNFPITYLPLPIFKPSRTQDELYSYLVLRKGKLPTPDHDWPRIVRPVLNRSRQVICRMCTNRGQLEEEIFTKFKNGKNTYRCARSSNWGHRLPVKLIEEVNDPIRIVQSEENTETEPKPDERKPVSEINLSKFYD